MARKLFGIVSVVLILGLMGAFMGCKPTQTTESTGQYVDNSAITAKVKAAIFNDESLKSLQISVETFKGEVQLSGFIDSEQSVKKAEEIARSVDGVVSVKNDLIVK